MDAMMKHDGKMPRDEQQVQGDLQKFAATSGTDGVVSSPRRTDRTYFLLVRVVVRASLVDVRAEQSGAARLLRVSGKWTRGAVTLVLGIDVAHPPKRFDMVI